MLGMMVVVVKSVGMMVVVVKSVLGMVVVVKSVRDDGGSGEEC